MIVIREMTKHDIPQISEVMCSCYRWLGKHNEYTEQQVDYLVSERGDIKTIQAESQNQIYLVACMNGKVVGMAAVKANEVAKLFVDPNCHGQDIGTMLFNSAKQIIAKGRYEEMIVGVMTHSTVGFYEKMGMSKYGEKLLDTGAFAGCKIPLMRKVLPHA